MSDRQIDFTKENIDFYLKELAKEYRKRAGKVMPAEIILIGGSSVLINYGFRNATTDIDAIIRSASVMKDIINDIGDRCSLPTGWLNDDFIKTASYSPKLLQISKYYRTYSNVLTIRTVAAEYLIAMKLRSGRQYKHDFSDILGVLAEHKKHGSCITLEQIRKSVADLYGSWDILPEVSRAFICKVLQESNYQELYDKTTTAEREAKDLLIQFEADYPAAMNESNINGIIADLQKKAGKEAIISLLQKKK